MSNALRPTILANSTDLPRREATVLRPDPAAGSAGDPVEARAATFGADTAKATTRALLHQLYAFMNRRMRRNAIEKQKLIGPQPQCGEHLSIESRKRLSGKRSDLVVEDAAPAKHTHHELGQQRVIGSRELLETRRMQELGGVSVGGLDAHQNFKCGIAGGGDAH